MSEKIPKAISESVIDIGGFELRVYQLDNGQRVIDASDIERFFGELGHKTIEGESPKTDDGVGA